MKIGGDNPLEYRQGLSRFTYRRKSTRVACSEKKEEQIYVYKTDGIYTRAYV